MDENILKIINDGTNRAYELGKKHAIESLLFFDIIPLIEKKNFTCDQLQAIIRELEEVRGSDYEGESDYDMTDDLREQNGEFDRE